MTDIEALFFYSAFGLCLVLSVILFFSKDPGGRRYLLLARTILIFEGTAIGLRWFHTGHPPVFGTFEECLAASWTVLLFAVILDRGGAFARISVPIAAATMLYGLGFDTGGKPLTISEQSLWVDFHALFAWAAYGFYTFSFICALGILLERPWARGAATLLYRWLLWGFLAQTIMFTLGSYHSTRLYGSWWSWDLVEYLFIISWLLYAIPVHGKVLYGWGEKSMARLTVLATVGTVVLYWGRVYFPWATYHIFDIELKMHG